MNADIVSIVAPSSAAAGDTVNVEVDIQNLSSSTYYYFAVTGVVDSTGISFSPSYQYFAPRATLSFTGSFTMPSAKVTITVYSWYWDGTQWVYEDKATKDVTIGQAAVWVEVASTTLSVNVQAVTPAGWVEVASVTLSVSVGAAPATGWVMVASATLAVGIQVVTTGWVEVASTTIDINVGTGKTDFSNLKVVYSSA